MTASVSAADKILPRTTDAVTGWVDFGVKRRTILSEGIYALRASYSALWVLFTGSILHIALRALNDLVDDVW
jgi:hypothetical protein